MSENTPGTGREAIPALDADPATAAESQQIAATGSPPERSPVWTGLLFLAAALMEIIVMLLMTWLRYRNQGLTPDYLAFGKTANLYGLFLALPFIATFFAAIFIRRLNRPQFAITAFCFGIIGILLLVLLMAAPAEDQPLFGVLYLAFKALELSLLLALFRPGNRSFWRKGLIVAIFTPLITLLTYGYVIVSVLIDPVTPPPTDVRPRAEYDAGVILGAAVWSGNKPSPVFRERIHKGYELLKDGVVEFIVLTGGNAPNEMTEAEVAKRELLRMGAEPTAIVLEEQTSSTVEQILFIRDELTKQGWESFVIISDQFHLKRALEICAFNDIEANGIPSESPLGARNLAFYHLRESAALILYWMFGL